MKIKLSESKCNELIRQSFKKLKAAIFFDKTQLILRDKLIAYETSPDFERKLNDLATKVMFGDWDEIIDSINVLSFPKQIVRDSSKELSKEQFITNISKKNNRCKRRSVLYRYGCRGVYSWSCMDINYRM